jgi:hypothetical protein
MGASWNQAFTPGGLPCALPPSACLLPLAAALLLTSAPLAGLAHGRIGLGLTLAIPLVVSPWGWETGGCGTARPGGDGAVWWCALPPPPRPVVPALGPCAGWWWCRHQACCIAAPAHRGRRCAALPTAPTRPDPVMQPRQGQSAEQTEADRRECNRWATTQPAPLADAAVFHRVVQGCMDGLRLFAIEPGRAAHAAGAPPGPWRLRLVHHAAA